MTLSAYSNTNEDINALSTDYPSSSDDEEAIMSPYNKSKLTETPSKIIAEAQRILFTQESRTDDDNNNKQYVKTTIEMNGILVKKVNSEPLEKTKKSVRFNMENNKTHEFTVDASDSLSSLSLDDGTFIANVLDASDLLASDSELSEDDFTDSTTPKEEVRLAFTEDSRKSTTPAVLTNSFDSFSSKTSSLPSFDENDDDSESRIDQMVREKSILQQEISDLRAEYEAEVKKLSEEYEERRESYLTDLDDLRLTVYDRLDTSGESKEDKMKSLEEEKKSIDEIEEDLKKRRKQCSEQEIEIEEYEKYLNRRHGAMNDKEEDLKTLQDELEEFARLLRKRERDLKTKSERLDDEETAQQELKYCPHDEKEISELREKVKTLQNDVLKTRIEVEKREETSREFENKLQLVEVENKKLQAKVKNLESKLLLDKKLNEAKEECSYVRRTSVMTMGNPPTQRLNGSISSSPINGRSISGRRPQLRSPVDGSMLSSDSAFFNNPIKRKITEETVEEHTTTQCVDSRSIKSRTCIVM